MSEAGRDAAAPGAGPGASELMDDLARAQRMVGRILDDKFRLRSCIGIGGSGAVYKADQIALGRTVAIKILREDLAADARLVKRFQDEALAASRLNHPNTVSIIDYGQTPDGLLYLVMEHLRGPTLTYLLARHKPLPVARVLDITAQVLSGLEEAHLAGVVHADIKSDNIVVEPRRTGTDQVKVVDFGIARLVTAPLQGEDRNVCGTPEYMAPELIAGSPAGFASDLYAVAIVMYELLVGETPFVGGAAVDILTRQLKQTPTPPSVRRADLPREVDELVLRGLAKRAADRFATAAEMRAAVEQVARGRRPAASTETVCQACGARAAKPFRFCPECGHPREASVQVVPLGPAATVEVFGLWPLPLVGRDSQVAAVARYLSGGADAPGMLIIGDRGVGRSAVVGAAYAQLAEAAGLTIYQAGPDPTGLASPLYPVRAVVATILELAPVCGREDLDNAALEHGLAERDLPGLAELFGHPSELADLETAVRRRELVAAAVRVLVAESARGPTAVVFEDVEAYDEISIEVLRELCVRSHGDVRIVATIDRIRAIGWGARLLRLELGPLDGSELAQLAAHVAQVGLPAAPNATALAQATDGSPAHLDHLLRFIAEGGEPSMAPPALADLVAARVHTLDRDGLIACQAVAVFGREASKHDAARASGLGAGIDRALRTPIERGLLKLDGDVVGFCSALVRDVVYDATPAHVRRELHAAAVEVVADGARSPAILGHHHDAAGHRAAASRLLADAGDEYARQLDDAGAAALYQRALINARACVAAGELPPTAMVAISIRLADALRASERLNLARGVLTEAESWGDLDPRLTALLLRTSGHLAAAERAQVMAAVPYLEKAIGAAIASGDGNLIADAYVDLATVLIRVGKSADATRELEQAIDLITLGDGPRSRRAPAHLWQVVIKLAQLAAADGDHRRAAELAEIALLQAQRTGARVGAARAQSLLAGAYERLGKRELAAEHRRAAVNELRRMGDRRGTAELLLHANRSGGSLLRIDPASMREALQLAYESGWTEAAERADLPGKL
jgi:serine/threonine-protein kinase